MSASCLIVIPARGGSRGVPRKNALPIGGKPLVVHAITAALRAKRVSRVVVSTDDPEIGALSQRAGAEVVWRPIEISGSSATSEGAVIHVLKTLASRDNYRPDLVMLMQCTTPMTQPEDLDGAIETLFRRDADSCFTAVPFRRFLWREDAAGSAIGINHDGKERVRRQDLAPQVLENGAAYVMRRVLFEQTEDRFCGKTVMHLVPESRNIEIDEPADTVKAEVLMRHQQQVEMHLLLPPEPQALVLDFDGVLTDNAVYVDQNGAETVRCDRGDGMGLERLRSQTSLKVMILSKERNAVVQQRATKLKVECFNAIDDKVEALRAWAGKHALDLAQVIYVGNDLNDLGAMGIVGCAVCPSDAHPAAQRAAQIILTRPGGRGAVRELAEGLISHVSDPQK